MDGIDNYYVAVLINDEWTLFNRYPLTYEGSKLLSDKVDKKIKVKILKEIDSNDVFSYQTVLKPNDNLNVELQLN